MKIALVVHDFLRGVGHGRYCIELARRFAHDHQVFVFANRFESNLDFSFEKRPVRALRISAITSVLSFIGQAERMLQKEKFDIIHTQGFSCRRADVITAHVCNAARYRIAPPRTFKERIFPNLVIPRERAFYASSNDSEIIAVSNVVKRELESEYRCSSVSVIYHGVDTVEFGPAMPEKKISLRNQLQVPANKWVWMFAGEAAKGLEKTIEALIEFPEAHLVVVSRSSLEKYQRQAKELGVFARILFVGAVERMAEVYQMADIFVYPSQYDTFGMVVAEAMASGLPVAIKKQIGAAEWIEDGKNGFVCEPDKILKMLREIAGKSKDVIDEVGQHARATTLAHSWEDCASRTLEIYQRAIAKRRKSK
ncbi:MAG: glycosyltransferase family 4 protein [Limisphaerales bacterium]